MAATPHKRRILREQLWAMMHDGRGQSGQAFQFLLLVLLLLSISILPLELFADTPGTRTTLHIVEVVITSLFTLEYLLRIYAAPNRLKYIFSFFGIIDFLSIAPFYLHLLDTQFLRALRLFRLVRIFRLGEIGSTGVAEAKERSHESVGIIPGEEEVEFVVSHHPLYLITNALPAIVAIAFGVGVLLFFPLHPISLTIAVTLFLFSLIFLWRAWLNYSYDLIYVTSQRLIFYDQHLLGRSTNQLNYSSITNVKPAYQGVISYLFGYGSLSVETAADQSGHFEFHMASKHEAAARHIMQKCMKAKGTQN